MSMFVFYCTCTTFYYHHTSTSPPLPSTITGNWKLSVKTNGQFSFSSLATNDIPPNFEQKGSLSLKHTSKGILSSLRLNFHRASRFPLHTLTEKWLEVFCLNMSHMTSCLSTFCRYMNLEDGLIDWSNFTSPVHHERWSQGLTICG